MRKRCVTSMCGRGENPRPSDRRCRTGHRLHSGFCRRRSGCDAMAYNVKLNASPRYTLAISAAESWKRSVVSGTNCGSLACRLSQSSARFRGEAGTLRGCMNALDPSQQRIHGFRPASHARSFEHELGQHLHNVDEECSFLILRQIVKDILRINADKERRELRVDHLPAHVRRSIGVSDRPIRHVISGMMIELVQLPFQSSAGIRRRHGLAKPEMIGAVQGRHDSGRTVDLLEVIKIVLGFSGTCARAYAPSGSSGSRPEKSWASQTAGGSRTPVHIPAQGPQRARERCLCERVD